MNSMSPPHVISDQLQYFHGLVFLTSLLSRSSTRAGIPREESSNSRFASPTRALFSDTEALQYLGTPTDPTPQVATSQVSSIIAYPDRGEVSRTSIVRDFHVGTHLEFVPASPEIEEAKEVLRGFVNVTEGWDGPGSLPPLPGVIQDALRVLEYWPPSITGPDLALVFDGSVDFELEDKNGEYIGGLSFVGEHKFVLTIISNMILRASATFDAKSHEDIIKCMIMIKNNVSFK